jgi:hypothetical protein
MWRASQRGIMKLALLLVSTSLLVPFAACGTDSGGELEEATDSTAEKDDGSKPLAIRDRLAWEGQPDAVTKVFTSAAAFQSYFGKPAPAEIDFSQEWAIYYALGTRNSGGYEANVLKAQLSASGKTVTVTAEEVSPGNTCLVTQALTSPATLVTIKKQTATRFQTRRTQLALACSAVCGAELAPQLEYGARGAWYPSEGDEPYTPVAFASIGTDTLTKARFLQILGRAATTNIDETDWATWSAEAGQASAGADDYEQELAREHAELIEMVNRHLTDVKMFDVGFEDSGDGVRPLYIVGKTSCGELAGYKTTIVAT